MPRLLLMLVGAAAVWALDAGSLFAQTAESWPGEDEPFLRGVGYYLSTWKILSCWVLFLCWVRTSDWISQDCLEHRLNYTLWNSVVFFTFVGIWITLWLAPWPWYFYVGYTLMVAAYAAPLATYIVLRNKQLEPQQRVLTKRHLRHWGARQLNKVGFKFEVEAKMPHEVGPDLQLTAHAAKDERTNNVNLLTARQSPGYLLAREALFDAIGRRADALMFDYGAVQVMVRLQIDGVWHNHTPWERANGDLALVALKTVAAMNPNERVAKQTGAFGIETAGKKIGAKITTQGTSTGERVLIQLEIKKLVFKSLDDLGMRPKMQEQLKELLDARGGFILFSSLPGGGLTTMFDLVLTSTDRFVRNFVAIEDAGRRDREIENVLATTYDPAEGETPMSVLPKLIRTYPDVIVIRDMIDAETVKLMIDQVAEKRLVLSTVRAREAVEALLRVLMLKVSPQDFAPVATAVLNTRLVRKLCETCKESYPPPDDLLRQLGLPPGRISAFYRPPTGPIDPQHPEKVCEACQGIGYVGRTGIFELLVLDDRMRQVLGSTPKLDLLRDAARKAKQRSLQEEGVLLVVKGVTSLPELMRVLKPEK